MLGENNSFGDRLGAIFYLMGLIILKGSNNSVVQTSHYLHTETAPDSNQENFPEQIQEPWSK